MTEVGSLYVIAVCAVAIAIGTFANLVLLVTVRRELKHRARARGETYAFLRRRIQTIEDFLLKVGRGFRAARPEPDARLQTSNCGRGGK